MTRLSSTILALLASMATAAPPDVSKVTPRNSDSGLWIDDTGLHECTSDTQNHIGIKAVHFVCRAPPTPLKLISIPSPPSHTFQPKNEQQQLTPPPRQGDGNAGSLHYGNSLCYQLHSSNLGDPLGSDVYPGRVQGNDFVVHCANWIKYDYASTGTLGGQSQKQCAFNCGSCDVCQHTGHVDISKYSHGQCLSPNAPNPGQHNECTPGGH